MTPNERLGAVTGYVSMMRPGNCIMGAAGVLLAAIICLEHGDLLDYALELVLSAVVVMAFTGAGNSLNDYFDRELDRSAHPSRPIPRGLVSPSGAIAASAILFSVAAALGFMIGTVSFVIVIASLAVMLAYEILLKSEGLVGNLAISWLTGALFLFGGAAVGSLDLAWILALLAFLATLGREIAKDIQDMEGDRGSRMTLPMRIGAGRAGVVASLSLVSAVALSPAPYLLSLLSAWYLPVVAVADAIFIYSSLILFRNPERGQNMVKVAMLLSLLAFLSGGIL
ncbi:TPA: UbiA family prenyltransferase [Thermoplasmata archaeon]|nr:UbiA family prenyltransferase [Thermoplasmata archaeon]